MNSISPESNLKKLAGVWIMLVTALVVFATYLRAFEVNRAQLELFTTINWIFIATVLVNVLPKGMWSICYIFYIAFGIFHSGLVLANSVGGITDEDTLYEISKWFYSSESYNSIYLINLAFIGLALGAITFSKSSATNTPPATAPDAASNTGDTDSSTQSVNKLGITPEQLAFNKRLFHIGGIFLIFMILVFFAVAISSGAIYSYGAYLKVVDSSPGVSAIFAYTYVFIGLAVVLISVSYTKGFSFFYFIVFGIWAGVVFKLGLRGEVMFPSAVAACMFGRKGKVMNGFLLMGIVVIFLIITGIVKNARVSGEYSGEISINPLNAVAELGSSLRAVQEVIKWRKNGDELLLGGSYWAPVERQFAYFVPQFVRTPAEEDPRLLNVVVKNRAGPIGFSPIAEAYVNFGEAGVFGMFFLWGFFFATLDNIKTKTTSDILIGVSLVPLFIMIRNSFTHVPMQILIGIVVASGFMYLAYKNNDKVK